MIRIPGRGALVLLPSLLLPSAASAECQCVCVRGKAIPICQPQAMVEPICQQICTDRIEQTLTGGGAGGGMAGGATGMGAAGALGVAGAGGLSPAAMNSLMGR